MATEARETAGLIGSDKVEGTYVYDAKGEHIGSIERVMIEKVSGQVAYAVLSFGGFLGIGSEYYPANRAPASLAAYTPDERAHSIVSLQIIPPHLHAVMLQFAGAATPRLALRRRCHEVERAII
jgi:hypothetical protein